MEGMRNILLGASLIMATCFCSQSNAFAANSSSSPSPSKPLFPAVILFGDSIVDPGNNNGIKTIVKCNFPPYGKDFVGHVATGRFCNGKIPGDLIASSLGVKELVPAYLGQTLGDDDLLTGVSFASGASGFDPETSVITSVLSMPDQLNLFREYKDKLKAIAGEEGADNLISESLFVVCAGSDDFANTYFIIPFRQVHYDIPSYVNLVINSATDFIQQLYGMGARKIAYVGLPPIGCLPSQRTLGGGILRDCVPARNEAAQLYNSRINEELKRLKRNFIPTTKLIYLDIYNILFDLVQRPSFYGFEVSNKGCCGTGEIEVSVLCNPKLPTCQDASKYVFWDSYHPTERAYRIIVDNLLSKYLKELL